MLSAALLLSRSCGGTHLRVFVLLNLPHGSKTDSGKRGITWGCGILVQAEPGLPSVLVVSQWQQESGGARVLWVVQELSSSLLSNFSV